MLKIEIANALASSLNLLLEMSPEMSVADRNEFEVSLLPCHKDSLTIKTTETMER